MSKSLVTLTVVVAFGLAGVSQAAVISGVTIQDVSSEIGSPFDRVAAHTVGASAGLDPNGAGTYTTTPDGFMWLNAGTGAFDNGRPDTDPTITWNLGGKYDVGSVLVYNYNEGGSFSLRGINTADVYTSNDGVAYSFLKSITLNQAPGSATVAFAQSVALNVDAQFIRFTNATDFPNADNGFVGLSHVIFNGTLVPEPSTFILGGLGLVGLLIAAVRRRRG